MIMLHKIRCVWSAATNSDPPPDMWGHLHISDLGIVNGPHGGIIYGEGGENFPQYVSHTPSWKFHSMMVIGLSHYLHFTMECMSKKTSHPELTPCHTWPGSQFDIC